MNRIKYLVASLGVILSLGGAMLPVSVGAADLFNCTDNPNSEICKNGNNGQTIGDYINTVVDVMLFFIGTVSVVTIIVGGVRYVTSHGEPKAVETAKNTVFYAVIGVVVAVASYAIVHFVTDRFFPSNSKKTSVEKIISVKNLS
ncbi:hypothetical protein HGB24_03550 [Candidatus Saccharibacteria bacterium]|nr:hypothetical protein [Candidatus Saccharibacteria bacterium]